MFKIAGKIQMSISPQGVIRVIRSTSCLVLAWGFRGRRIEWRYFRFDRTQDGGLGGRHLEKFKWRYLRNGLFDSVNVQLQSMALDSAGSNGAVELDQTQ